MPFSIIRNDITKMAVDAIVNAANTELKAGGGVCGAIFTAAGADKLQKACNKLAPIQTGEAAITKGYGLPSKYVIHTAGPVYNDGQHDEELLLRSCYRNALDVAKKHKCKSIAFPLISSGIYGYPKDEALHIATSEISKWLMDNDMEVSLVVFDKEAFMLSGELLGGVKTFIDENYADEQSKRFIRGMAGYANIGQLSSFGAAERSISIFHKDTFSDGCADIESDETLYSAKEEIDTTAALPRISEMQAHERAPMLAQSMQVKSKKIDDVIGRLDEPFSTTLLRIIEAKGKTDIEVYRRANIDRKLFSKIRTGKKGYMPSKKTVVALAVALELSLRETRELLERAGFALSRSVMFDVIIEYFIEKKLYDIFEINNVLFEYDQPLLGG